MHWRRGERTGGRSSWSRDGTDRTFFEIVGCGHTWPGSDEAARWAAMGIGTTTAQIDATAVSWDFLQHHHLA